MINQEPKNLSDIQPLLRPLVQKNPKYPVLLQIHNKTAYGDLIDVMDELKQAGVTNISLPSRE